MDDDNDLDLGGGAGELDSEAGGGAPQDSAGGGGWAPTEEFMDDLAGRVAARMTGGGSPPQDQGRQPQGGGDESLIEGNPFLKQFAQELRGQFLSEIQPMLTTTAVGTLRSRFPDVPNEVLVSVERQLQSIPADQAANIIRTPGSLDLLIKAQAYDLYATGKLAPPAPRQQAEPGSGGGPNMANMSAELQEEIKGFEEIAGRKPTQEELRSWGVTS